MQFKLSSPFSPTGDQPQAIDQLVRGLNRGQKHQVLLGVTGSGKTFTMSNVIAQINRPTLIISHNKTLAGQLYQEYRDFFPDNAVSYFVSYYDYYQPEAYIPQTDTYIEKETEVNDLIDKLRLEATTNLMTRKDVIVVASVSCIYNIGSPTEYERNIVKLSVGEMIDRLKLIGNLTDMQYQRNEMEFNRGSFRIRGEVIDIWPAYEDKVLRINIETDRIKSMIWIDPISSSPIPIPTTNNPASPVGGKQPTTVLIYPAKHYLTDPAKHKHVFNDIRRDLSFRVKQLESAGKLLEAHRLAQKTEYDLEMIQEVGYVNGIENYSRYFDGRKIGDAPHTLLDYFAACDPNFLVVIDESHISIPQIRGMYHGDKSRKQTLIDYGFRLPAALDNRPLTFDEFLDRVPRAIYTSATPDEWEVDMAKEEGRRKKEKGVIEQLIRPTGLIDPEIEIRPVDRQVPDLVIEIMKRKAKGERVLVTTLTKKTAEDLAEYLQDKNKISEIMNHTESFRASPPAGGGVEESSPDRRVVDDIYRFAGSLDYARDDIKTQKFEFPKVAYLHADVHTLDRQDILDKLRSGEIDVLVGINLLREGLDLPEVSLVAILDADQEGFLRSRTSLIQTMGRAARHINGKVIMYAAKVTNSMKQAIDEVNRRRQIQIAYNLKHNIMPTGITKPIRKKLIERPAEEPTDTELPKSITKRYRAESLQQLDLDSLTAPDRQTLIRHLRKQMLSAADRLDFEFAARIRDEINKIDPR